jgi:hypothetical protein
MPPRSEQRPSSVETVPLYVRRAATIDIERAAEALRDIRWLGEPDDVGRDGQLRRVKIDLELPILDGSSPRPVRKICVS